ncbi:hypothetical protein I601_0849 [Nocardioides dokdonensis FR1436]|uniref:Uncharacterized protein n=1 Tax=Nocardioides dokdonensis FR1436 TaxID=1300347 RepID=A0A1A9GIL7_9ACTN|nr:hypothetical protein I601_0849 [Nocardioides dokdonensis FR1436]
MGGSDARAALFRTSGPPANMDLATESLSGPCC